MHDTMISGFGVMIIFLSFWVCTSVIFCLAFLGAAARRVPRMDDSLQAAEGIPLCPVIAAAPDQAKTTGAPARGKPHSTPVFAKTATSAALLLPRPEFGAREVPLLVR
jgi:hypothetical protein